MTRRHALLAALFLVSACATRAVYSSPDAGMVELEPLLGAEVRADALVIRVTSTGCTAKDDIVWFVERAGNRVAVAFGRKKIDACKAAPQPMEIAFSYAELGLKPGQSVAIVNPLAAR
ncbi:hypothetical protein [Caulobacter sp. NIBR1757]|uniref:hypothetical protein n=1 Tax=Caulobacter sp. NIBR1757 TaxID=3016000 RepID=UPI0022F0DC50|nr:hypothetical protein [Caulobacter sp. NIBR1757]WGM39238.1 hypothetical protein AMEJIAPC_02155 [Caulobacter sp. NIBR1757]